MAQRPGVLALEWADDGHVHRRMQREVDCPRVPRDEVAVALVVGQERRECLARHVGEGPLAREVREPQQRLGHDRVLEDRALAAAQTTARPGVVGRVPEAAAVAAQELDRERGQLLRALEVARACRELARVHERPQRVGLVGQQPREVVRTVPVVMDSAPRVVQLGHQEVERLERALAELGAPQDDGGLEQRGDRHRVPVREEGRVRRRCPGRAALGLRRESEVTRVRFLAAAVGASPRIEQGVLHPADDPFGRLRERIFAQGLVGLEVGPQALRVAVEHLLVVRGAPVRVGGEAEEAALDRVVDLALLHLPQRAQDELAQPVVAGLRPADEGEVDRLGMGELVLRAPTAVLGVGGLEQGGRDPVEHAAGELPGLRAGPGLSGALRATGSAGIRGPVGLLGLGQPAPDRLAVLGVVAGDDLEPRGQLVRIEVGVVGDHLARVVEVGERRPATLRVARVDIGPPVLVHPHADELLTHESRDARVREHLALELGREAAPRGAQEEQHRALPHPGFGEDLLGPLAPLEHAAGVPNRRTRGKRIPFPGRGPRAGRARRRWRRAGGWTGSSAGPRTCRAQVEVG